MFEKKLLKYKDRLDVIFPCCLLETTNVNIVSGHILKHLSNCPINITYVVDPMVVPTLGTPNKL
jgi:hypothetical protein